MLEFADQEKHTMARQSKGRADRRHCETEDSASSRKSMFIRYSRPAQDVIQRKQTTPLADRLREQGIDPGAFGPDFARLTQEYDALPNTAPQRAAQQRHLRVLLDLLAERINAGEKNPRLQTALNILQDELNFVGIQKLDAPPVPPAPPWEHMNGSPYLRMIAELALMDAQKPLDALSGDKETAKPAIAGPVGKIPSQQNFSALDMIQTLSRHHVEQLIPMPGSPHLNQDFFALFDHIKTTLLQEACLSHYTHNPGLSVLHSTDYLRANQVLEREKLAKSEKVNEGETVSKSQDVDTAVFRNTGFVFFFLERTGSSHRNTDFGDYRFTVPLNQQPAILNDAWAILHDMAGQPQSGRAIRHAAPAEQSKSAGQGQRESITRRIFSRPDNISAAPDLSMALQPALAPYLDPAASLFNMLSMFLPTAEQNILLQTPDGNQHDTLIRDHISGNFLRGADIIDGIALRIAHELTTLREYSVEEYHAVMGSGNALWDYISGMVHDVQIMVPHDVLPMQYDFIDRPKPAAGGGEESAARLITRPVGTRTSGMQRVEGLPANAARILSFQSKSANNCFFDAMFPLMNISGIENASALRNRFVELQNDQGLTPLPSGAPVEYPHIQQFANLFHVTITVMAEVHNQAAPATGGSGMDATGMDATGMDAVRAETVLIDFVPQGSGSQNHYYIRFLPPADPQGIGHFTGLTDN